MCIVILPAGVNPIAVNIYIYIYIYIYITYLLTPWCRVLLEKLTGLQLVKNFPAFYGTRMFITELTTVRHLSLSCASPIQSTYPHPTSWKTCIYIYIYTKHICIYIYIIAQCTYMYLTIELQYLCHCKTDITVAAHWLLYNEQTAPHSHCIHKKDSSAVVKNRRYSTIYFTLYGLQNCNKRFFFVLQTGGPISSSLLEVTTEIIDDATCRASCPGRITDRMICADTPTGGKSPCNVSGSW